MHLAGPEVRFADSQATDRPANFVREVDDGASFSYHQATRMFVRRWRPSILNLKKVA